MTAAARLRIAAAAALLASLPLVAAQAQPLQPIPPFSAHVVDATGTLAAAEKTALESKLAAFQAAKGAQIAVLIVPTTGPEEIEQYAIRVFDTWKIGREKPDDGALLLVAKEDRELRIEVGRGLEGALTDLVANRIVEETIVPRFREGDFAGGIAAGVDRMIGVVNGEALPPPDADWKEGPRGIGPLFPFLFFIVIFVSGILRAILGRALGSVATGAVTGGAAWILTKLLGISMGVGVVGLVLSLLIGFGNGGRWSSRGGRGWTTGGWGGGGFGSSGGGGGFGGGGFGGGGGGSSAGGGASGRW